MGRYCDGDQQAFFGLYQSLAPRILAYLIGLCGHRATAEDLLQQTFLKVHAHRADYVRGANPVPWIYTIAHRTCLDELRRGQRAQVRLTADGDLPAEPVANITGAAAVAGTDGFAIDDAAGAPRFSLAVLDGLPPNQKEALILTKVHGHSVAQAAMIAGTTPGAIKLRAHRAYVALRGKSA